MTSEYKISFKIIHKWTSERIAAWLAGWLADWTEQWAIRTQHYLRRRPRLEVRNEGESGWVRCSWKKKKKGNQHIIILNGQTQKENCKWYHGKWIFLFFFLFIFFHFINNFSTPTVNSYIIHFIPSFINSIQFN